MLLSQGALRKRQAPEARPGVRDSGTAILAMFGLTQVEAELDDDGVPPVVVH